MDRKRDFAVVEDRIAAAAERLDARLVTLGEVDGYPIRHMTFGSGRPVVMTVGIHGEEPGSVEGGLLFLEGPAKDFSDRIAFEVFPCLNPFGYERHHRLNARGDDPNRQFRNPDDPLNRLVRGALGEKRYDLGLDLHEDEDFDGMYLFEITDQERFGPSVRDAMAVEGPVCPEAEEPPVRDGLVERGSGSARDVRAYFEERPLWPIAFLLYLHTDHVMTLETPGHQPLDVRARMHRAGVVEALNRLMKGS